MIKPNFPRDLPHPSKIYGYRWLREHGVYYWDEAAVRAAIAQDRQGRGEPVAYGIFYCGVMQSWAWHEDAAWAIAKEDYDNVKTSILPLYIAPQPAGPCATCNDKGAVGNILNAEPCPDCTPQPAEAEPDTMEEILRRERERPYRIWPAEPVKGPSDDNLGAICRLYANDDGSVPAAMHCQLARALLARYGNAAQPAEPVKPPMRHISGVSVGVLERAANANAKFAASAQGSTGKTSDEYEHELDELGEQCNRIQNALAFWMPDVPDINHPLHKRIAHDAYLLFGYDGSADEEPSAQALGHITLNAQPNLSSKQKSDALLSQALAALKIAEAFCGAHTAEDCPDTIAIPINEAVRDIAKAMQQGGQS